MQQNAAVVPDDVARAFRGRNVLVTGASGFVGGHVARMLRDIGANVRALIRAKPGRILHDLDGVEIVAGDLLDEPSLDAACAGIKDVFHVAADYRFWSRDPREIYRSNVDGTLNMLRAARRADRIVYTSTIGVLKRFPDGRESTELDLATESECKQYGAYKHSKLLAQIAVNRAAADGVPVVSLLPTTPVGEADVRPTPTGRIIVEFLNGRIPLLSRTGLNVVDVRIAALGHLLAATRGSFGELYLLGGENLWLAEIFQMLESHTTVKSPTRYCPEWLAYAAALASEGLAWVRLVGEPFATRESVRLSKGATFCSWVKARSALGLPESDIRSALERAANWFAERGVVSPRI